MTKEEFVGLLDRFKESMSYVDELAQVTLKGHLLIEEALTRIIEQFVFYPEHIDECRLGFHQKLQMARAFCLRKNANSLWSLMLEINAVRNDLAHALQSNKRKDKIEKVRARCMAESPEANLKNESEHIVMLHACALCVGFLARYEIDAKAFRKLVDDMDRHLNPTAARR